MRIAITGVSGKLGGALRRAWEGSHEVVALWRRDGDFRDPGTLEARLREVRFDVLVNAAAMAGLEECERHPEDAGLVNAVAPDGLARICRERGGRFVHFSTDYVLEGSEPGRKDEGAPTGPVNVYGRTKLEGEERVLAADASALVCRVSWIFNTDPPGFIESFVERARSGGVLEAAADKFSMPTCAEEIAAMVLALLARPDLGGVFHLTHDGHPQSWYSCGRRALEIAREEGLLEGEVEVVPRPMDEIARLEVRRPIHTAMEPRRLREEVGWPVRSWEEAARAHFRSLLGRRE